MTERSHSETRWFWFKESLLDERDSIPLGKLEPDGTWTWAPGEPQVRTRLVMEIVTSLPEMVAAEPDYRWDSPHENITEGEPWGETT